ncbi:carbonic anhydrase 1-like isoform X2 [Mercenaria mercenaria]|uniref:carbonic anhydrase 1-like isoform X2 n=1 Tax=Mercenaria mercenaria TaxID=6596 RepID=UPI00234F295C|nr:carbonic anhydrase 1-like isoform X2 [Mercenaria mercenaria]
MRRKLEVMEITIIALFLLAIEHGTNALTGTRWSYRDNNGPEKWPELFPNMCAGLYQSPIDIPPIDTVYNQQLTNFVFYDQLARGAKFIADNNGKSIEVDTQGQFLLAYGGLQYTYRISQFHFHWGGSNDKGSEHTINEEATPMEMHIVTWNVDKYSSIAEAAMEQDGLAVLGILFSVSHYDNPLLEPLVKVMPYIKDPEWNNSVEIPVVSPSAFLPNSPEKYYRYHGSLTTPRCYESVTWTVFKERQTISEKQLNVFRQVLMSRATMEVPGSHSLQSTGEEREPLVNNFRPVQPLNGRVVKRSYQILHAE